MLELHQIIGAVLFIALAIYLSAFWGSALFSLIWGKYVYEGSVNVWNLPRYIYSKDKWFIPNELELVYIINGLLIPFVFGFAFFLLVVITKNTGSIVPYIFLGIMLTWLSLFIMRAIVRLTKRLESHEADKSSHN